MENQNLQELLQEIRQENEIERNYLKKQLNLMKVLVAAMTGILVVLVLIGMILVPRVKSTLQQVDVTLNQVYETTGYVKDAFSSLDGLVGENSEGVATAIEKLNQIDIDSLNQSIKDLGDVVEPLRSSLENSVRKRLIFIL